MDTAFTYPDLQQICERGLSFVGHQLISTDAKNRIRQFAKLLPQGLRFPLFGFESPLSRDETWGDIGFYIDLLKETSIHHLEKLPKPWQKCLGWNRLCQLAKAYYERYGSSEEFAGFTPIIPIEFDVGSSLIAPHTPSIFFVLQKEQKKTLAELLENHKSFFDITNSSLALIQKCDFRKYECNIESIGFMLSRPLKTPIKIQIGGKGITRASIPLIFEELGIAFPSSMEMIVQNLALFSERTLLSVDIAEDKIREKIAIEFIFSPSQSVNLKQWKSCFEILQASSIIQPQKSEACLNWCGHSLDFIGNSSEAPYSFLSIYRSISHLKIVYVPAQGIESKIYLRAKLDIIQKNTVLT